jgi:hypothetical protein
MASKRVFIAFAIEDVRYRDFLAGQSKLKKSPFEFIDMSVKQPWDENWKTNCRTRIKGCHGVVALISKHTKDAVGQLWEIQCAYDEKLPIMLMWINNDRPTVPAIIKDKRINIWSWENIEVFIKSL